MKTWPTHRAVQARLGLILGVHRPDDGSARESVVAYGHALKGLPPSGRQRAMRPHRQITREKIGGVYPVELREGEVIMEAEPWTRATAKALRDLADWIEREPLDVLAYHAMPGPLTMFGDPFSAFDYLGTALGGLLEVERWEDKT